MSLNYNITPIFKISVKDGKTSMTDNEYGRYRKWCLSQQGEFEFIIKRKFKQRSLPANAYFHGVVVPMIAEEIGEEPAETKALLKAMFLSKEKAVAGKDNKWEMVKIVGRTSKLSTHHFGLFVEKCRQWASSFLGLVIPDPSKEHNSEPVLINED